MNLLRNSIVLVLAAAAPSGVRAQVAPPSCPDAALEAITVYARRLTPVTHVAAAVTVITGESIATTLAADAKELVRYEPGLR